VRPGDRRCTADNNGPPRQPRGGLRILFVIVTGILIPLPQLPRYAPPKSESLHDQKLKDSTPWSPPVSRTEETPWSHIHHGVTFCTARPFNSCDACQVLTFCQAPTGPDRRRQLFLATPMDCRGDCDVPTVPRAQRLSLAATPLVGPRVRLVPGQCDGHFRPTVGRRACSRPDAPDARPPPHRGHSARRRRPKRAEGVTRPRQAGPSRILKSAACDSTRQVACHPTRGGCQSGCVRPCVKAPYC